MHWTTSRWDGGSHSDGKHSSNDGGDGEEDKDGDKDEEDEDEEDEDEDEENEDKHPFYDSEILSISNWDLAKTLSVKLQLYVCIPHMNYLPS